VPVLRNRLCSDARLSDSGPSVKDALRRPRAGKSLTLHSGCFQQSHYVSYSSSFIGLTWSIRSPCCSLSDHTAQIMMHCDGGGLYLDVDPSGARRWFLRTMVQGVRKDVGIGPTSLVSLAEAREMAVRWRGKAAIRSLSGIGTNAPP